MKLAIRRERPHVLAVRALAILGISSAALASAVDGTESTPTDTSSAYAAVVAHAEPLAAPIAAPAEADFSFDAPGVEVAEPVASVRATATNAPPPRLDPEAVMAEAAKYVGTPYLWAGSTPAGFDCSGFTSYVFKQLGVTVPRSSSAYWNFGVRISAEDALPGDLVLTPGHVGIYAGNGMQIDSPHAGATIQFRPLWQWEYVYIRVP